MTLEHLILELYDKGLIKFGDFTLKSGAKSSFYLNLREIIAYPSLLKIMADMIFACFPSQTKTKLLCGVPYSALTLASYLSVTHDFPMLIRRKESKNYGTKQKIEGVYQRGDECFLIEDVVTTGASILETTHDLQEAGVVVKDVAAFIDRKQGGTENLAKAGITLHAVLTMKEVLTILNQHNKIDPQYQSLLESL